MSHSFVEVHRKLLELIAPGTVGDISLESGWMGLLRAFVDQLAYLPTEVRSGISIQQIKEKYGELRVYAYAPDDFFDLVGALEIASNAICGVCGREGCMRDIAWRSIRCRIHSSDREHAVRQVVSSERQLNLALGFVSKILGRQIVKQEFEEISHMRVHTMNGLD